MAMLPFSNSATGKRGLALASRFTCIKSTSLHLADVALIYRVYR